MVLWGVVHTCGNLGFVLGELASAAVILVPGTSGVQGQEAEGVKFHVYINTSQYVCVCVFISVCVGHFLSWKWNRLCVCVGGEKEWHLLQVLKCSKLDQAIPALSGAAQGTSHWVSARGPLQVTSSCDSLNCE